MKTAIIYLVLIMGLIACKQKNMELTQKEKAFAFLKSFETSSSKILPFIDENIKSHNYGLPDGKCTYEEYFTDIPTESTVTNIRIFEDKDIVVMHNRYTNIEGYSGPLITFDVCRFENGKIVEHWDNICLEVNETINGNSQIDGAVEIKDISSTEKNRAIISEYLKFLINGELEKIAILTKGKDYIQHNPEIGNSFSGVISSFEKFNKKGIVVELDKVHNIFAEGNFVLSIVEGRLDNKPTSFYDLFRLEGGLIAEHWDVIEEIQPKENWNNENTKF